MHVFEIIIGYENLSIENIIYNKYVYWYMLLRIAVK